MNLVIDCFKLVKGAGKSIGIYNLAKSITGHLGQRLLKQQEEDVRGGKVQDSIIVFGNSCNREDFDVPGVTFIEMKGNPLNKPYCILWELFLVTGYAQRYHADRILFPRGFRPMSSFPGGIGIYNGGKRIRDTIIIHDLIPFYYDKHYPGVFNKLENAYIMNRLKVSMQRAGRIITISDFSRKDILNKVPGCERKIAVINNGLNDVSFTDSGVKENTGKGGSVKPDYIVAMTSGLPHKNAKGILRTYEAYYRQAKQPLDLAVIGIGDTSVYPEMDREAASHVTCYKFFAKFEEMCRLAAGGQFYLFLSYVEGFGFPPLEAMQLGLPVICSDRSSLPEVVADAGILVDPDNTEGVVQAMIRLQNDEVLRKQLIEKGYENIKRFSWDSRTDLYWKELFQ